MTERKPETEIVRARQRSAARTTAILLVLFVVLVFAVTIAKLSGNQ
jgi:preprotein translocase subunit SecG